MRTGKKLLDGWSALSEKQMSDERSRRRTRRGVSKAASWYPVIASFALAFACLAPTYALAAVSEICGDGIDNDASGGDVACPSPDSDRDGYYTNGAGPNSGTDCDDTNRYIYPGVSTSSGCSAGNYRTCQSDGTYTACAAVSAFTCHSGSGATYWIDAGATTCAASNSYASPSNMLCFSDTTMTNYHAPVAGDCFVFKAAGSFTSSFTDGLGDVRMIYVVNKDCTSTDRCKIMAAPGQTWWELGQTSGVYFPTTAGARGAPNEVEVIEISNSNYWDVSGLEINGASGFSNAGITHNDSTTGGRVYNNAIYNIRADAHSLNLAGYKCTQSSFSQELDHNLLYDNFDDFDASARLDPNTSNVVLMDCDDFSLHDNVMYYTAADPHRGYGIKIKHPINSSSPSGSVKRNVIYNNYLSGIAVAGHANTIVSNNYLENVSRNNSGAAILFANLGDSDDQYDNLTVTYNTIVNSPFFEAIRTSDPLGSTKVATVEHNVVTDDRATSYPSDTTDGMLRIAEYGPNSQYTSIVSGNLLTIDNNCYYNTAATTLYFGFFGDSSGIGYGPSGSFGAHYSGLAAWQAIGYDANSYAENPTFDGYGRATSTNCADKGWLLTSAEVPTFAASVNFRNTAGYVTDGTGQTYNLWNTTYPTTRAGITFGFTSGTNIESRDRSTSVDVRLAGLNVHNSAFSPKTIWRLDLNLAAPVCTIRAAFGDQTGSWGGSTYVRFCDGTCGTPFATISAAAAAAGHFYDASGVDRASAAAWVSDNVAIEHTFTNSNVQVEISDGTAAAFTPISHFDISCATETPVSTSATTGGTSFWTIRRRKK